MGGCGCAERRLKGDKGVCAFFRSVFSGFVAALAQGIIKKTFFWVEEM